MCFEFNDEKEEEGREEEEYEYDEDDRGFYMIYNRIVIFVWLKCKNMKELKSALGTGLFLFIIIAQHISKGFIFGGGSEGFIGRPIEFLFQSYGGLDNLNAQQIQLYKTVAMTPWSLKSIIGMLTDTIYICGYNKLPYIFITMLLAILSCVTLPTIWPVNPVIITGLFFFIYLFASTTDLLTEAMYSQKITQKPKKAADIVTFVWVGIYIGQIMSTVIVGLLLDSIAPHLIYYIPVPFIIFMLYTVYNNWMGDKMHINESNDNNTKYLVTLPEKIEEDSDTNKKVEYIHNPFHYLWFRYVSDNDEDNVYSADGAVLIDDKNDTSSIEIILSSSSSSSSDEDDNSKENVTIKKNKKIKTPTIGININKIEKEWRCFLLAAYIGILSITTSIMAICQVDTLYLTIVSFTGAIIMIIGFNVLIEKTTARIQTFSIIQNMLGLSIGGASFFFFTDNAEQYPEGPHFSKKFYVIVLGVVGSICSIIGSMTYLSFMKHWNYRTVFLFNNVIYILVGLLNVVFYKRLNLLIGIPDTVFILGAETIIVIVAQWTNMPMTTMMSQLCPKGMEATMFALLAGSSNLGSSLSQYQGAWLLHILNIKPRGMIGESAQFENLWIASLIATLLPFVTIIFIPFLIPNKYQTDNLLKIDDENDNKELTKYINIINEDVVEEMEDEERYKTIKEKSTINRYRYNRNDDGNDNIFISSEDTQELDDDVIHNTTNTLSSTEEDSHHV